jgi:Leucine-rich repeat (LRR) protein
MKIKLLSLCIPLSLSLALSCCTAKETSSNKIPQQTSTTDLPSINNNSSTDKVATTATNPSPSAFQASISKLFPDPELAKIVAGILHKDVNDIVTKEELASYKGKLDCAPGDLSDLAGIGYLTGITSISCCKNYVKAIPPEIKNLVNLESLDFTKAYALENIPLEIGYLKNLKYMSFSLTEITSIPKEIGDLRNLDTLLIRADKIQSLPNEIGNLEKLQCLDLGSNILTSIPDSISNLTDLRMLDLSNNALKSLPANIGNLSKLQTLNLFNNKINSLPKSMENMIYLDSINVYDNIELSETYKNFMPKLKTFTSQIQLNSNCDIELPFDFESSNMRCQLRIDETALGKYNDYTEITPNFSNMRKLTLDKSLFTKKGKYEFRVIQKNSSTTPLYNIFVWNISVEV